MHNSTCVTFKLGCKQHTKTEVRKGPTSWFDFCTTRHVHSFRDHNRTCESFIKPFRRPSMARDSRQRRRKLLILVLYYLSTPKSTTVMFPGKYCSHSSKTPELPRQQMVEKASTMCQCLNRVVRKRLVSSTRVLRKRLQSALSATPFFP